MTGRDGYEVVATLMGALPVAPLGDLLMALEEVYGGGLRLVSNDAKDGFDVLRKVPHDQPG